MKELDPSKNIADEIFTPPAASSRSAKLKELFKVWLLYRLPALAAWVWVGSKLFSINLPGEFDSKYLLLPILGAFLLLLVRGRVGLAVAYPLYVLLSPLLAIILPTVMVVRVWRSSPADRSWIRAFARLIGFARSFKALVLLLLIVFACWFGVEHANVPNQKATLALIAHITTYILFLQTFRWASNPYKPVLLLLEYLSVDGRDFLKKYWIDDGLKKPVSERGGTIQFCDLLFDALNKLHRPEALLTHGITAITHGSLSAIFIGIFVLIYVALSISFGLSLLQIELGWGKILSGLGETPDFLTYFYFSFLSQATAVPDGVQPAGPAGQIWIIWLVFTGILLLTGLITLFSSSSGIHSESTLEQVDDYFRQMKTQVRVWRRSLKRPTVKQ
jgi:hypothetical protein